MADEKSRLHRQFDAIGRMAPLSRRIIDPLLHGRLRQFRVPIACLLILGSFLSILPVLGLWMLPLGLMLLALDVPLLRPWVSNVFIRTRRRIAVWRQSRRPDARRRGIFAVIWSTSTSVSRLARLAPNLLRDAVYCSFAATAFGDRHCRAAELPPPVRHPRRRR